MNLYRLATEGIDLDALPLEESQQPRASFQFESSARTPDRLRLPGELDDVFNFAAQEYGVDVDVLRGIAYAESRFNPDIISGKVKSPAGAIGLMQFMPETAKEYGIDPTDPVQSIIGGAAYLRNSLDKFGGDYERAVASYNWGPNRKAYDSEDWASKAPAETQKYLMTVFDAAGRFKDGASEQTALTRPETQATPLPAGVAPSAAGGGRGFVSPGDINTKLTRTAVPEMTAGSVARDIASGALQIGPTVVQGVGDLIGLASGNRLGGSVREFAKDGKQAIREMVGSERAQAQAQNLAADMADEGVGFGQMLANNKGALADMVLPTIGSMAIPLGAAGAAGKAATLGKAAQGLDKAALAARVASAQQAAGIGATAAQNAASTFVELLDKGVSVQDAYVGAGITVPFSLIAGKLTGGGAEGALIRGATNPASVVKGAAEMLVKAPVREGAQEGGEALGQLVGESVATETMPTANAALKQVGTEALLGAVMGGGMNAAQQLTAPRVENQPTTPQAPTVTPQAPVTPDAAKTQAVDNIAAAIQEMEGAATQTAPVQPGSQAADAGAAPVAQGAADTSGRLATGGEAVAAGQPEQAQSLTDAPLTNEGTTAPTEQVVRTTNADGTVSVATWTPQPDGRFVRSVKNEPGATATGIAAEMAALKARSQPQAIQPTNSLSRTASWVIKEKATGNVILETFDKAKVDALNTAKYEAVPIQQHLASLSQPQPVTGGLASEMAAIKSRAKNQSTVQPLLTDEEAEMLGDFERLYQADIKGEIKDRLGLTPKPEEVQATQARRSSMTPFKAFLRDAGISSKLAQDITGANAMEANRKLPGAFRKNGLNLDLLVQRAKEEGFMSQADEDSNLDNGGVNQLVKLIQQEFAGTPVQRIESIAQNMDVEATDRARAELDDKAMALGLGRAALDLPTEQLANIIGRIERRLGRPVRQDFGTRKMLRSEINEERRAILMVNRIQRARAQYDADIQAFAESSEGVQDAVLEIATDADGNVEVVYIRAVEAAEAADALDGQWSDQNAEVDTSRAGAGQENSGQAGAPVAQGARTGTGNPEADRAEAGAGAQEAGVVRTYKTKSGEVAATVKRNISKSGSTTYSYIGKWGAGSGHSAEYMAEIEADWKASKKGFTVERGPADARNQEALTTYTPAEVIARQDAAAEAEATAKRAEDAAASAAAAAKQASEIAQRSVAAADTFELGQSAEDNLSGQAGLKFSFAGTRAATADRMSLMTAQDRIDAGEDAEVVRQQTGWHKGVDGRWRFEISDNEAKVDTTLLGNLARGGFDARPIEFITYRKEADGTYSLSMSPANPTRTSDFVSLSGVPESLLPSILPMDAQDAIRRGDGEADIIGPNLDDAKRVRAPFQFEGFNALPLGVVMDHPKLFAAYPALRDIMVQVEASLGNGATFAEMEYVDGTEGKAIKIGNPRAANVDNVLLHEIQHGIQSIEGFATGGSPKGSASEYAVQTNKQLADLIATSGMLESAFNRWSAFQIDMQNGNAFDAEAAETAERVLLAHRDGQKAVDLWSTLEGLMDKDSAPSVMRDRYKRLAGEVEARNTQARQGMTDAERRATPPSATADVADNNVVVVMNGREMAMAPMPANAQAAKTSPRTTTTAPRDPYGPGYADLAGKDITYTVPTTDGKTASVTVDAQTALTQYDQRLEALEKLRKCL